MLDKIKTYVIGALLLLVIGQFVYNDIVNAKKERDLIDQRNKVVLLSSVVKEDSSTFSKLILEATSKQTVNDFLKSQNADLAKKLKNAQSAVVITVSHDTVKFNSKHMAFGDSLFQIVDSTVTPERIMVGFLLGDNDNLFSVKGATITNPPAASVEVYQKPFNIFYAISQNEDDTWKATIDFRTLTNKPIDYNVNAIDGIVNPKPIKEASIYNFGIGASISQDKLAPGILLKVDQNIFSFNYKIIDKLLNDNSNNLYNRIEFSYYRLLTR